MTVDEKAVADLVTFSRVMLEARDLEPWADMLGWLRTDGPFDDETAAWAVKLYNAYDDLGSAMGVMSRWPTPDAWAASPDSADAARFNCTQERRNLRGGRVLRHLGDYVAHLGGGPQMGWLRSALDPGGTPEGNFDRLVKWTRELWGVGRQTSFEWAEFAGKSLGLPVSAGHGFLWASTGPRRAIQRIYRCDDPTPEWLDEHAALLRDVLAAEGVEMEWWDFETAICDFNVMRDGRYYPGRHLAALTEEIDGITDDSLRDALRDGWNDLIPEPWRSIKPGINGSLLAVYRDSGTILCEP